jgi:hypothetical protein
VILVVGIIGPRLSRIGLRRRRGGIFRRSGLIFYFLLAAGILIGSGGAAFYLPIRR